MNFSFLVAISSDLQDFKGWNTNDKTKFNWEIKPNPAIIDLKTMVLKCWIDDKYFLKL